MGAGHGSLAERVGVNLSAADVPTPHVRGHSWTTLGDGWAVLRTEAGAHEDPPTIGAWTAVDELGPVAAVLGADLSDGRGHDAFDWWFARTVSVDLGNPDRASLHFLGLATNAEVWIDGALVLRTRNMHRGYMLPIGGGVHRLVLCFRALAPLLRARGPRARWKTGLVAAQTLRFHRTTLLGRIASWQPQVDTVGPWRPVLLQVARRIDLHACALTPGLHEGIARLRIQARWTPLDVGVLQSATLVVGDLRMPIEAAHLGGNAIEDHTVELPGVAPWWPHTHGDPALHPCALHLEFASGTVTIDGGRLGFKSFEAVNADAQPAFRINGQAMFARGACWTTADVRRPHADPATLGHLLRLAREAGMNMLRVVGSMVYENDTFHALCDAMGILVWQDFMFANMDYPFDDPDFAGEVLAEAREQVQRLRRHASTAVYCGGSEIEQQAAMMGLPPDQWRHPFFAHDLPGLCARLHPGSAWFSSTPTGGALPFHTQEGICHYYGVGAYRRGLDDVRLAGVRFASESLGFSNVPEPAMVESLCPRGLATHAPAWKAGVPRDGGAGWDFEDIRDHYFPLVVGVDAQATRLDDPARYLDLARRIPGELMARAFAFWRGEGSGCQGALIWFFRDLVPGAGWGVVDSTHQPKSTYWYLRRCFAARAVLIDDRGLAGLDFVVRNDAPRSLEATLHVELWRQGRQRVSHARRDLAVPAHGGLRVNSAELFGHFLDINHVYRFGPREHDCVVARLEDAQGAISEDFFFIGGLGVEQDAPAPACRVERCGDAWLLHVESAQLLKSLHLEAPGWLPDDNDFHLTPQRTRLVRWRRAGAAPERFAVRLQALNMAQRCVCAGA